MRGACQLNAELLERRRVSAIDSRPVLRALGEDGVRSHDVDEMLSRYSELTVRIGLNLQPGQRLLVIGPLASGGVALDAAPLVRQIARSAYQAGSPLVEAVWGDEGLQIERFAAAPRDSFGAFSDWFPKALLEHVEAGH